MPVARACHVSSREWYQQHYQPAGAAAAASHSAALRGRLNTGETEYSADGKALGVFGEDPDELFGGARIAFILENLFSGCMRKVREWVVSIARFLDVFVA